MSLFLNLALSACNGVIEGLKKPNNLCAVVFISEYKWACACIHTGVFQMKTRRSLSCRFAMHQMPEGNYSPLICTTMSARIGGEETRPSGRQRELKPGRGFCHSSPRAPDRRS